MVVVVLMFRESAALPGITKRVPIPPADTDDDLLLLYKVELFITADDGLRSMLALLLVGWW